MSILSPLYGGGFWPAFSQLCVFYYAVGALLHWAIPSLFPVQNVQQHPRKPWTVARDAFYSIGAHRAGHGTAWLEVSRAGARTLMGSMLLLPAAPIINATSDAPEVHSAPARACSCCTQPANAAKGKLCREHGWEGHA